MDGVSVSAELLAWFPGHAPVLEGPFIAKVRDWSFQDHGNNSWLMPWMLI